MRNPQRFFILVNVLSMQARTLPHFTLDRCFVIMSVMGNDLNLKQHQKVFIYLNVFTIEEALNVLWILRRFFENPTFYYSSNKAKLARKVSYSVGKNIKKWTTKDSLILLLVQKLSNQFVGTGRTGEIHIFFQTEGLASKRLPKLENWEMLQIPVIVHYRFHPSNLVIKIQSYWHNWICKSNGKIIPYTLGICKQIKAIVRWSLASKQSWIEEFVLFW